MSRPPSELQAFVEAAQAYRMTGSDLAARRMFRSVFSGVAQDVAAAVLTVAAPNEKLEDAIASGRVVLSSSDREAVTKFMNRLPELRADADDQASRRIFGLPEDSATTTGSTDATHPLTFRAAVPPEPSVAITAVPSHFSASSLNMLAECRRKWFYRYLCGAIEDEGSSASWYGIIFHDALEALHKEFAHPGDVPLQTLRSKLQGYLTSSFDHHRGKFETQIEFELQRRRALRTAVRYVEWLCAQAKAAPFTVIGCELEVQLDLEGFSFIGYIDRLDRDDASAAISVIDYKTGKIAATAEEYRERVRQFKEFQLPFYYWARTAEGDRVARLALVPLKDALGEVMPLSLEVVPLSIDASRSKSTHGRISIEELERARARMIELCREVSAGALEYFAETKDAAACTYCAYEIACIGRPYPLENPFAR
ncbi:MAG: PD-(D/E)XK nuclease family protein [Candidatus Eremiobacteraeota bacterium]|nr:PD-(D/E)XK nuclease family protein [Candidatus Eremiobacteraeota bacterium]